jgi:probable blue pigment (indigoidine) exporter
MPSRSLAGRPAIALIGAAAAWGIGTAISKRAVEELPPLLLLGTQLAVSIVVLVVVMRLRGLPLRDPHASPLLSRLGILNPGIAYLLSLIGLTQIGASLSVLLWATEPIWILGLAAVVLRERIRPAVVVASVVAVMGIALVVGGAGEPALVGVALTTAGVVCCAIYTVAARRWIGTADATAPVLVAQQAYALAVVLVAVVPVAIGTGVVTSGISVDAWVSAGVSGVLYYAAAYLLYLSALRTMPASTASASFYLVPLFGLAASFVLLGERLDPVQWVGAVIVIAAVAAIFRMAGGSDAVDAQAAVSPAQASG